MQYKVTYTQEYIVEADNPKEAERLVTGWYGGLVEPIQQSADSLLVTAVGESLPVSESI